MASRIIVSNQRRWTKRISITLLLLIALLFGYGVLKVVSMALVSKKPFWPTGTDVLVWEEEVPLHDGRVIVIKRREVKSSGGFPINTFNKRGITRSYEFCYPPMGLYWKSKGGYRPEILNIVEGKAYVKVPISTIESCMFHDYPATNAIYFVWEGSGWKKIPYEQFPKEVRRTNLLLSAFGNYPAGDVRDLVIVSQKEARDDVYGAMKRTNGRIQSLTDYPSWQGACEKARHTRVQTDRTSEVFLPPTPDFCQ